MTFEEWLLSDDGRTSADYRTLTGEGYLRNRLWHAYQAGKQAGIESKIKITSIAVPGAAVVGQHITYEEI